MKSFIRVLRMLSVLITQLCSFSVCFTAHTSSPAKVHHDRRKVILQGVLSRSAVMNSSNASKSKFNQKSVLQKYDLIEIIDEALFRQNLASEALNREVEKSKYISDEELSDGNENIESNNHVLERVGTRKNELSKVVNKLQELRVQAEQGNSSQKQIERIKSHLTEMGFGKLLTQSKDAWKTIQFKNVEFGRPNGFDGKLFYSPLGVPILVSKQNAHKDAVMRNAAQGSDLWFQVEDYNGSRVLLRTSLKRGTKGSKECIQMAADLAAKFSVWGESYDRIPVMYTDSRKVAKRGSKVGQMKQKKSLGRILGRPHNIKYVNTE